MGEAAVAGATRLGVPQGQTFWISTFLCGKCGKFRKFAMWFDDKITYKHILFEKNTI